MCLPTIFCFLFLSRYTFRFQSPNISLSQLTALHPHTILSLPVGHKHYLDTCLETSLDRKPYKTNYVLQAKDALGNTEVCRTVCPSANRSQMIVSTFPVLRSVSHYSLPSLCCQCIVPYFHSPQILTHKNVPPKNQSLFERSQKLARILAVPIYFLTQGFKAETDLRFFKGHSENQSSTAISHTTDGHYRNRNKKKLLMAVTIYI